MNCPKCKFENRDGVKFCEECGATFEIECPACKAKIPSGRKFCGECGHNLTISIAPEPPRFFRRPGYLSPATMTGASRS